LPLEPLHDPGNLDMADKDQKRCKPGKCLREQEGKKRCKKGKCLRRRKKGGKG
jgi:hypothetical protein